MADKLKLLFVDDDSNILSGLRRMFRSKRAEWDMRFACGGEEALEDLSEHAADVVVSDMKMPDIDGATLLKIVAERYPTTKRIVLSGQAHKNKLVQVAGFAHQFLSKPCQQSEMVDTLTQLGALPRSGRLDNLSGLSGVYCQRSECQRLMTLLDESNPSEIDLVTAISGDIGLSAKVFQLTATSFFSAPVRFGDLRQSLNALGVEQLRSLLSQDVVFRCTSCFEEESKIAEINRQYIREAKALEAACAQADSQTAERAYFQGLLRGVGTLGLMERVDASIAAVESRQIAEATRFLLQMWGIQMEEVEPTLVVPATLDGVDRVIDAVESLTGS
ncbi:MAG: response regulator [Aureliella sp.]